ncbi:hypothetical protein HC031_14650 [Planosporangium thailandense]|uniref:Uncharacterized protein n=1 Tax=Planosporangium thailandense TaxID=765197 RepID=A0ABX0Y035_9ACTN|nr:hypothetical protein [Planosporangium thailandense]NJC70945.1 hypothetical protein [Planosporangium thailandense]
MIQDIGLYAGEPEFAGFAELGPVTAEHKAWPSGTPSMLEVNAQLQAQAARLGADAVIRVVYTGHGRRLKAVGIAVKRVVSVVPATVDIIAAEWDAYSYC